MPKQSYENTLESHHLLKNIPTFPYGDPKDRHAVSYDDYVKNGGYEGLRKAISMKPSEIIDEVKASEKPIIMFIDEAHTLIGAGGAAGSGDAANLLKPALARGELRTVAATTWSEYKKYFEKDPALARRFQAVKVDEPDTETAVGMMRGLRERYDCLLYTSPSPRDRSLSRMPSSA